MSCEIQFLSLSTLGRPGWQNDSPWKGAWQNRSSPCGNALKAIRRLRSPCLRRQKMCVALPLL
jgi:hypothetical protein